MSPKGAAHHSPGIHPWVKPNKRESPVGATQNMWILCAAPTGLNFVCLYSTQG